MELTPGAANETLQSLVDVRQRALAPTHDAYDFIAIGGGTAGLVATAGMATLGARCALIERTFTGGDCLVGGCVPSKALLHVASVAHRARTADEVGVCVGSVSVDFAAAMDYVRSTRATIAEDDSIETIQARGVDVIAGEARFESGRTLRVGDRVLRFKRAMITTGARPRIPPAFASVQALTNESLFELTEAPDHLAIVGGGPIGCEMAQAFARLGVRVTLLQRGPRLLTNDDPEAAKLVAESLQADGVELRLNCAVDTAIRTGGVTTLRSAEGETIEASHVLVAVGRQPNIEALNLDAAGVESTEHGVVVDRRFRSTNRRIYAAGDVASPAKFTHAAWAQAEYAVLNAFFPVWLDVAGRTIPHATYTDPEVAHVGMPSSELQARADEFDVRHLPRTENDRARTEGETVGFTRVYLTKGSDRIVAATVVGRQAGEAIVEFADAITQRRGLSKLVGVVRPYPTRSAIVQSLAYEQATDRIAPWMKQVARWWIKLLR